MIETLSQKLIDLANETRNEAPYLLTIDDAILLKQAASDLRDRERMLVQARRGLERYADEDFYKELAPSLATEDRGEYARWVLREITDGGT